MERITGLLNEPPLPQSSKPLRSANRTVEFDDVHFSYPQVDGADSADEGGNISAGEDAATTNGSDAADMGEPANEAVAVVSFTVPEGGAVKLVGPSGAGKSTPALLLARFHDVDAGSIRIGGVDVRQMTEPVLRSNVGLVLQQVQLPSLSLKENIVLGRFNASMDDIIAAAKAAHIHERIMALPRGYDSVIGDDALLSGGEAQRVSIARVILRNTPILIMDEATSAADPETETEIQSALSDLVVGRTVAIIAHRLQTIQHADNILVIDHGRIIQSGSHAQFANAPGAYADMWQAQQSDKGAQTGAAANALTAISKEDRS
ncbi:MAG: ATP-binding cassette domain-containing protein [Bifidobacterium tibiigranuli]|uniref:ABC transporter ATP-binding protein n=1 Tax=Bifidobacterium tibiigranuli TaxID=2172043 RepID=UPI002356E093|nr:ATP-binding cassette domain-containing protein [Bifidobacterium tibiigranuli]MCH4189666.1 ATP-binding cassette domain-containing protein [Bifidobacterium tibiigranuli]MCH4204205.1 ATP-binding cassette domain-containing protein [Bifidobacterium tibiigranuli]MCH4274598.1 ATP-binding cassette domain-containing protein [Bifidobacterium tibiigranuli]MCI1791357.1 ATP-binding cassette domain-containing protein [Bifidobacterium tibiigranuli]